MSADKYDVIGLATALATDVAVRVAQRLVDELDLDEREVSRLVASLQLQLQLQLPLQLQLQLPPQPGPDRQREEAVFRQEGEFWTLEYAGRLARLRDCRGFQHLSRLLSQPNTPLHVLALVMESGGLPIGRRDETVALHLVDRGGNVDVALDDQAKVAYRTRLHELDVEVDEAREECDLGRLERATAERDFLLSELARAVGLRGRDRCMSSATERARVAVRKAIHTAIGNVEDHHPELAAHLSTTVRTGIFCCYAADVRPAWSC